MKKITLAIFSLISLGYTVELNVFSAPYITYLNYSGSDVKRWGYDFTLYGNISVDRGYHVFEWSIGHTFLDFKGNTSNWSQNDYTLSYTNYLLFPWYGKVAFHYIATPNEHLTKGGKIYLIDLGYVKKYNWDAGLEYAFSDYKYGVNLNQVKLHAGKYIWKTRFTGFYLNTFIGGININKKTWYGETTSLPKKNYVFAGAGLTFFTKEYSIYANISAGERIFEVDKGGFVVYNLKERYIWKAEAGLKYYVNKNISLETRISHSYYKEDISQTKENSVNVYTATLSIGYRF